MVKKIRSGGGKYRKIKAVGELIRMNHYIAWRDGSEQNNA
jgi:hypothetical protein